MKLRNISLLAMAAFLLTGFVSFAQHEGHHQEKQVTVKGELIDTACYMAHPDDGVGDGHRKCALMCTRKGIPMSVLDAKGELYLLLPDHSNEKVYAQAKEWAADQVEVSGRLVTQGGLKAIVVSDSKRLSE
jgi:hypothetical protein